MRDRNTWGFEKTTAKALDAMVGTGDFEYSEGRVRGNGTGVRFWRFTLNEDWGDTTANEATCDLLNLDFTDTGDDVVVKDPDSIFATLSDTDKGWCFSQDGIYYAIQAPCPA